MTDLTSLDSPSTLYLPLAKETGLSRRFNRRSTLPSVSTPTVIVQMVDSDPPPLSPVRIRDESLLSPPPHTFRSRGPRSRRLPSTRPKLSPENTSSIRSPNYLSLHPKSPESPSSPSSRGSTLSIVRPETTLCEYPLPMVKRVVANSYTQSVRGRFGGILAVRLSVGHFTRLLCTPSAVPLLSPPDFALINPLQICLRWVLSRASGSSFSFPTLSVDTLSYSPCFRNPPRVPTVFLKPLCNLSAGLTSILLEEDPQCCTLPGRPGI